MGCQNKPGPRLPLQFNRRPRSAVIATKMTCTTLTYKGLLPASLRITKVCITKKRQSKILSSSSRKTWSRMTRASTLKLRTLNRRARRREFLPSSVLKIISWRSSPPLAVQSQSGLKPPRKHLKLSSKARRRRVVYLYLTYSSRTRERRPTMEHSVLNDKMALLAPPKRKKAYLKLSVIRWQWRPRSSSQQREQRRSIRSSPSAKFRSKLLKS